MTAGQRMNVLITGGSGLIGSALTKALIQAGHSVRHLGRRAGMRGGVVTHAWDPAAGTMDTSALDGVDTIVHLAGAGIADKRWTNTRVEELIASRAGTSRMLLENALAMRMAPRCFISAAGINFYGALTTRHVFTEADPPGMDTIGRISKEWEASVDAWSGLCRVVKLRTPVVLSAHGGALPKLMRPAKWGLGAPLGSGSQWMPWVHLDDLVSIYMHAMTERSMTGPYNVNSGNDVTNSEMMRAVAHALGRPFFLPAVPGFLLKIVLGEMACILLEGSRADNARLLGTGYRFKHPTLEGALAQLLQR